MDVLTGRVLKFAPWVRTVGRMLNPLVSNILYDGEVKYINSILDNNQMTLEQRLSYGIVTPAIGIV